MQTTRNAVRYYIDREADTPVIRSVPVARPSASPTASETAHSSDQDATTFATESRGREARHRLTRVVQASVRKYRHNAS